MVAAGHVRHPEIDSESSEIALRGEVLGAFQIEFESVITGRQWPLEQILDAPVGIGQGLGQTDRPAIFGESVERDMDARRRNASLRVENVSGDRRCGLIRILGHAILRA